MSTNIEVFPHNKNLIRKHFKTIFIFEVSNPYWILVKVILPSVFLYSLLAFKVQILSKQILSFENIT